MAGGHDWCMRACQVFPVGMQVKVKTTPWKYVCIQLCFSHGLKILITFYYGFIFFLVYLIS